MRVPTTRYVHTDRGSIAYQCFGEGDPAIVVLEPWVASVDSNWDRASNVRRWEFYASLGTVLMLDFRGFGSSDPLPTEQLGSLEEMSFDVVSVLDALGIAEAVIVASGHAAHVAVQLAVEQPARVNRLALMNVRVAGGFTRSFTSHEELYDRTRSAWGTGTLIAARFAQADEVLARTQRHAAPPSVAAAMVVAVSKCDVTHLLRQVRRPTLVMFTGDVVTAEIDDSRAFADAIADATFIESLSSGFYWGPYADDLATFITGRASPRGERDVAAIVFTDIVGSTNRAAVVGDAEWRRTLAVFDTRVDRLVAHAAGQVVKQTGDGHLLAFRRPTDAITATCAIVRDAATLDLHLRAGIHFAEVERRVNGDLGGLAVHVGARISALANADEILVSRTVVDSTAGGGWTFAHRGAHELKGVPGSWDVYALQW